MNYGYAILYSRNALKYHIMKRLILLLIATSIAFSSSAIGKKKMKKVMDSWLNATKHRLYTQLGPPAQVTTDGVDGEIAIYADRIYMAPIPLATGGYTPAVDYYRYRMFLINKDGVIYGWRLDSKPNPPERVDVNLRLQN